MSKERKSNKEVKKPKKDPKDKKEKNDPNKQEKLDFSEDQELHLFKLTILRPVELSRRSYCQKFIHPWSSLKI